MIPKAYIVPGQPHILLAPEKNMGWASLKKTYEQIGKEIEQSGAELLLVYSTQWFSVIGHLFQVDPKPKWTLVDQNWYEFGEIPYEFPIDTGTVVALKLLNPNNAVPASIVSCNIYAERDESRNLGFAARAAVE